MSKVLFLNELAKFTRAVTRDTRLPVRQQEDDSAPPLPRPPGVYRMRLPYFHDAVRKAPYILHQVITWKDIWKAGERCMDSSAVVRTVFCVYGEDREEGAMSLLNLMEQVRIALLEHPVLVRQYELDLKEGVEALAYPDDDAARTAPYYLGEMVTVWHMPPVKRLDTTRVIHGMPPWDPHPQHLEETIKLKGSE